MIFSFPNDPNNKGYSSKPNVTNDRTNSFIRKGQNIINRGAREIRKNII